MVGDVQHPNALNQNALTPAPIHPISFFDPPSHFSRRRLDVRAISPRLQEKTP